MTDYIGIRRAAPSDLSLLYNVCRLSYSENFASHWNEGGLEWYLEKVYGLDVFSRDLSDPNVIYFIAFDNENAIGFMKLKLNSNLPDHPSEEGIEIDKLYFRPQYQGKGIGKLLISTAISMANELKLKTIWLGVIDTNEGAIAFYQKMGFEFFDKTRLELPYFKEELKGMWRMKLDLKK